MAKEDKLFEYYKNKDFKFHCDSYPDSKIGWRLIFTLVEDKSVFINIYLKEKPDYYDITHKYADKFFEQKVKPKINEIWEPKIHPGANLNLYTVMLVYTDNIIMITNKKRGRKDITDDKA